MQFQGLGNYTVGTGAVIYQGSLVCIKESSGRAQAATAAAGVTFLGVASETKTGNTAGTVKVNFAYGHEERFPKATALTKAYVGCTVAVSNDDLVTTMSAAGTAGVQVRVGELLEIDSTFAWVWVRHNAGKVAP